MKYQPIIFAFLVLTLFNACEQSDEPISDPAIRLSINTESIPVGSTATISAEVVDIPEDIFAVSLRLSFNSNRLTIDDSQGNWLGSSWPSNAIGLLEIESGIIYLSITQIAGSGGVGDGNIFSISFTADQVGVASFDILPSHLVFYDSQGSVIAFPDMEAEGISITIN